MPQDYKTGKKKPYKKIIKSLGKKKKKKIGR